MKFITIVVLYRTLYKITSRLIKWLQRG